MRVRIEIDGYSLEIATRDPELLARWLGEVFTAIDWSPATLVRAQAWPGFVQGGTPRQPHPGADWIADSRIITRFSEIKSPQEFVDMLQRQINERKKLTDG